MRVEMPRVRENSHDARKFGGTLKRGGLFSVLHLEIETTPPVANGLRSALTLGPRGPSPRLTSLNIVTIVAAYG
jgi:hypothetical protein